MRLRRLHCSPDLGLTATSGALLTASQRRRFRLRALGHVRTNAALDARTDCRYTHLTDAASAAPTAAMLAAATKEETTMTTTITSLAARSISHTETAHASLSTLVEALRAEAAEAGDTEQVRVCRHVEAILDGSIADDESEGEAGDRALVDDMVSTLIGGAGSLDVEDYLLDVDGEVQVWGTDEAGDAFRVHLARR